MSEELSQKILERINEDHIVPLPKWRFLVLRSIFWVLAILSIIFGSIGVSTILYLLFTYHLHGVLIISHDVREFLLMTPILWMVFLSLFVIVANESIKRTKGGYRHRLSSVVGVVMLASVVLGAGLNFLGLGKFTHEHLRQVSLYKVAIYDADDAWSRHSMGRLAGTVNSISGTSSFSVIDFDGEVWEVKIASTTEKVFLPLVNSKVRMFGIIEPRPGIFIARSITEWEK